MGEGVFGRKGMNRFLGECSRGALLDLNFKRYTQNACFYFLILEWHTSVHLFLVGTVSLFEFSFSFFSSMAVSVVKSNVLRGMKNSCTDYGEKLRLIIIIDTLACLFLPFSFCVHSFSLSLSLYIYTSPLDRSYILSNM